MVKPTDAQLSQQSAELEEDPSEVDPYPDGKGSESDSDAPKDPK